MSKQMRGPSRTHWGRAAHTSALNWRGPAMFCPETYARRIEHSRAETLHTEGAVAAFETRGSIDRRRCPSCPPAFRARPTKHAHAGSSSFPSRLGVHPSCSPLQHFRTQFKQTRGSILLYCNQLRVIEKKSPPGRPAWAFFICLSSPLGSKNKPTAPTNVGAVGVFR